MNKKKNKALTQLFLHLEGIVTAPTLVTLSEHKIIDNLTDKKKISLNDLSKSKNAQIGYLNVALSTLASLGIVVKDLKDNDTSYILTEYGNEFLKLRENYNFYSKINGYLNNFIAGDIQKNDLDKYLEILLDHLDEQLYKLKNLHSNGSKIAERIAHHLEGVIIYPLVLYISHKEQDLSQIKYLKKIIKKVLSQNSNINVDETYNYIISRSKSYGVTASYQPIFSNLGNIIFNNQDLIYTRKINSKEIHVNRRLNVWGSGGAHKTYFKKIDSIIIEIFNSPIESQPKGIADMGCGDGMFLNYLYSLILNNTLRGQHLTEFPLTLIGADLNQEALDVASKNLLDSKIHCNFLIADISNPEKYKDNLKSNFNIDINELFHVRSFLDHNRIYSKVNEVKDINFRTKCAYAYKGNYISSNEIISNLIHHFKQWKNHINKHGLLLLELHGIDPELSASNKSKTPTIAYEATHGYSDQFILEYEVFLKCAQSAGLNILEKHSNLYPNEDLTTISLNIFR